MPERARRRRARRGRQAPAERARAASTQIRGLNERDAAPPRQRDPRGRRARPRARRRSPSTASAPRRPSALDAPLIALGRGARARARAGGASSPTSSSPRARTCSGSSSRCATARPEPDVRTLQGWRREVVGDELLELLDGPALAAGRPRTDDRGYAASAAGTLRAMRPALPVLLLCASDAPRRRLRRRRRASRTRSTPSPRRRRTRPNAGTVESP